MALVPLNSSSLEQLALKRLITSNVTACHQGPKQKLWAGYTAPSLQGTGWSPSAVTKTDVMSQAPSLQSTSYFSSSSVVSSAFSALCVYLTFRHHPHPLGYLCAKFHLCGNLCCWASPWRKIA